MDDKNLVNENQNAAIPSIETKPSAELSATPSFTRGPWRQRLIRVGGSERIVIDARGKWMELATVYTNPFAAATEGTGEANARLIAAAPALYEAACFARSVLAIYPMELSERMAIEQLDAALTLATTQVTSTPSSAEQPSPKR